MVSGFLNPVLQLLKLHVCMCVYAGMWLYMDPIYLHVSDISDCAFNGCSCYPS